MTEDVTELKRQRAALQAARANPARRVEDSEMAFTYRSQEELANAIRDLDRRIAAAEQPTGKAPIQVHTSKGL